MALICAICNNEKADVVCHHCGKPLCKDDKCRFSVDKDEAFSDESISAFHCNECLKKYHNQNQSLN
ncbi:MAG: hypothetical protein JXC36_08490 [Candidatus Atribacteria bacterium]|nr:hypothetical protein [Candidatus Atribacteria bacterium]